jgi:2-polyprenyl-6-methoxyphenol hydroxylase-like FAD-dependent oxidoreductase
VPEVLVVGAGPVGLALAADLRVRGVDVEIVEKFRPTARKRIFLHVLHVYNGAFGEERFVGFRQCGP